LFESGSVQLSIRELRAEQPLIPVLDFFPVEGFDFLNQPIKPQPQCRIGNTIGFRQFLE
jgi:hypothetical protein